ncbi:MAG: glycoside hydrolase family 15 protein [Candidatus Saccharimonadota bacterium]
MARPIVLSNGELHVGLNKYGVVHDLYYPYVGFENHAAGPSLRHKVGVFVDGELSWTDDESWTFDFHYPHTALIGHTMARNERLGIMLEFDDTVDAEMSVFMRNIHVINHSDRKREIKLFMYQAFAIGDSRSNTDTAQYLPDSDAILHYRGRRAFIISGKTDSGVFDQYSIGLFGIENHEGSYRDAEDGELGGNNVEHGRVDSILRFTLDVSPRSSSRVHYWISAGMSSREALYIHKQLQEQGMDARIHKTAEWWHDWLRPSLEAAKKLPVQHQDLFIESMMIIKSQLDKRGAVIASTDSTMLNYSRDAYAYSWPRDGANTVWPLIRLGYYQEAYRFFEFCQRGLHPSGYLMHKYRADGALGSSWHPYVHGDIVAPPIQEDETALVVFVFVQFYQLSKDSSLIKDFYHSMIKPMANFMSEYTEEVTGLPRPSYDLWEQTFSTSTYTTAVTYGALVAASELATVAGDSESAVKWRSAADDIQAAAHKYLFNKERQVFNRGINVVNGEVQYDTVLDNSAVFSSFMFGLFAADSHEIKASIETVKKVFNTTPERPGLPRYEDDDYRRAKPGITGNWWYITTLWQAQYDIETGNTADALKILDWIKSQAMPTGMMGEQIDPIDGAIVSPAPLTWSHAEYVATLIDLLGRER